MFFLLPALAVVAETAAAVTGGVLATAGTIGTTIATGTAAIGGIAGTAAIGAAAVEENRSKENGELQNH